jgi:hypothetical protein
MNETEIVVLEVTPKEMEEILTRREQRARDALIAQNIEEIVRLVKETKALGGRVLCSMPKCGRKHTDSISVMSYNHKEVLFS